MVDTGKECNLTKLYSVVGGLGYYKGALHGQSVLSKDKLNK